MATIRKMKTPAAAYQKKHHGRQTWFYHIYCPCCNRILTVQSCSEQSAKASNGDHVKCEECVNRDAGY